MLTQRDSGLMAQFSEFIWQLRIALLSLKTSKTLADTFDYAFDPAVDKDGNDMYTQLTRPARKLPASCKVHWISRCNCAFYSTPDDAAEAALLKEWVQYIRLMDSDAACGAFLLDPIK